VVDRFQQFSAKRFETIFSTE